MTDAKTLLAGLIGRPVEHSVSPAMHNAAFEALGLNWRYTLLTTEPGQVEAVIGRLREEGFRGANVTVPHKQAVMPYLDDVSNAARAIGAVNTIVERRGAIIGHNTDADGFMAALRAAGFEPSGRRALLLGAGGAARAVVFALLQEGTERVLLLNRTVERAQVLADHLDCRDGGPPRLEVRPLTAETLVECAQDADLLVNTTPVGMWPHGELSIWPDGVPVPEHLAVFDLVYNPLETRLLRQARECGARPIGGLEMLVRQGALAFELWTGERAPLDVMRTAAERALEGGD